MRFLRLASPRTRAACSFSSHLTPLDGSSRLAPLDGFSRLTHLDVEHFASIVGGEHVITAAASLHAYNTDWTRAHTGEAPLALRPSSTAQVSRLLAHCHARRLPLVPQGGNTGLVRGGVPLAQELVLSLGRMDRVLSFSEGVLACEAGCVLQALETHVGARGHVMPLDLGAKGSCMIGGNLATNAGGVRFLRYGSLRASTLGLVAVLADGTVLDSMRALRKDNTGYDLKQLFIGSEGTLGVITECAIACPPAPASTQLAFLGLPSFAAVLRTHAAAAASLSDVLSACEFLDASSHSLTTRGACPPLPSAHAMYMLIELGGADAAALEARLLSFLQRAAEEADVSDAVVAQSAAQAAALWRVREDVPSALLREGHVYKYDVSLPLPRLYELVEATRRRVAPLGARVSGFGHVGDGNLHLNAVTPGEGQLRREVREALEPFVYEWVGAAGGSVSAEHGIGATKRHVLHFSKSAAMIELMRKTKRLLDPHGILNPNKVIPDESVSDAYPTPDVRHDDPRRRPTGTHPPIGS